MGGVSLSVHPLFFAFGIYYALTGRAFVFVVYTVTAVVHELGHSLVASSLGYRLNKITLMPFGAVVKGDVEGLKFRDEFKIALAGPIINFAIGVCFVAIWWTFPETYAFTDVAASANFSMATVNLLPVFPLDGGRALGAFLKGAIGEKKAKIVCSATGAITGSALIVLFVFSLFSTPNLSLLFFSLFVLFGAFGKGRENKYVKLYDCFFEKRLRRGIEVKKIAVDKSVTIKKVMGLLDENRLNEVDVYDKNEKIAHLSFKKITEILQKGDIYAPIEKFIK